MNLLEIPVIEAASSYLAYVHKREGMSPQKGALRGTAVHRGSEMRKFTFRVFSRNFTSLPLNVFLVSKCAMNKNKKNERNEMNLFVERG